MQGEITIDAERRFLRVQFDQSATVKDWVEARAIFLQLSEETEIRRALVDLRQQQIAGPVSQLFAFGQNIPSGITVAVLGDPHSDDHKFVETVALNRGKTVRLFFGSEDEAIEWLMTGAS